MRMFARSYLDVQQLRVSVEHRMMKMHERAYVEAYASMHGVDQEEVNKKLKDAGKTERKKLLERIEQELDAAGLLKKINEAVEKDEIYRELASHHDRLHDEEKFLLKQSQALFKDHPIWVWCERVRGLGPVAAMTFLGYIDPYRINTAGKLWAFIGEKPGQRMISGTRGKYNPELKGRFWMIGRNIIMAQDDYYAAMYDIEKKFYHNRPDMKAQEGILKGWKGKTHAMAMKWMRKMVESHALEIMRRSEELEFFPHRFYIPPKPADPIERQRILQEFEASRIELIKQFVQKAPQGPPVQKEPGPPLEPPDELEEEEELQLARFLMGNHSEL